ncbi:MAG: ATP-binding cassette domain-containing protein [Oscillospiraceae bacterium]|nr:ATP-binding cassette domain-containing protein [Oscillospiraceae bacterium]
MLEVKIKKHLGAFDLDVEFATENEIMALLGASGCGKSMTLKCIAGIEKPDEGLITLNGRVLFDSQKRIDLPPQKRRIGYLFQQYALFPNMTVYENIACGVRVRDKKLSKAQKADIINGIIKKMQLEGIESKYPSAISGGQQQRVALARILVNDPEVILLDEPFSALDEYLRWQVELEIADTLKQFGRPAIFVSHSRDEVYRLCKSVCVLADGRSSAKASVGELFSTPDTLASCLISGCKNFSRFTVVNSNTVFASDWGAQLRTEHGIPDGATTLGVRSHYLRIVDSAGENTFPCTVERVIEDVFSGIIMLSTPVGSQGYSRVRIDTSKQALGSVHAGDRVFVHVEPGDIMLLKQ